MCVREREREEEEGERVMEVSFQMQRPICCRNGGVNDKTHFKIKPFLGFFPTSLTNQSAQSSLWRKDCTVARFSVRVSASSDFSRKKPRKVSNPRSKDSAPKRFMPKPSSPRKDQYIRRQNEQPSPSTSKKNVESSKKVAEIKVTDEKPNVEIHPQKAVELENETANGTILDDISAGTKPLAVAEISHIRRHNEQSNTSTSKDNMESSKKVAEIEVANEKPNVKIHPQKAVELESANTNATVLDEVSAGTKPLAVAEISQKANHGRKRTTEKKDVMDSGIAKIVNSDIRDTVEVPALESQHNILKATDAKHIDSIEISQNVSETQIPEQELLKKVDMSRDKEKDDEEGTSLKLKLEMEALLRKKDLERLIDVNFLKGSKIFSYPEVVKPNQDIEVFFNRSLSALSQETDVLIMGAFNDWRYKSFTIKLNKTQFSGDWWSCQVHVPKEAYKIDFVFFNGEDVYENNDTKDFCINVEGGIDVFEFENFLLEEKRRELEKLAEEQAEKERKAEEQRRIEAEKEANEADRTQARAEAERRRGILQELVKKAVKSVDNLWFIEPSEFKGEDMVRLYYNRRPGPLANAKEVWIHGGYNNWKDGLSIVARLVSSERKDGDWWYTDVIVPDRSLVLDWVFANGPPQHATLYDNNQRRDFHAIVPKSIPEDLYWVEEEREIYRKLQAERRIREEAIRAKAEKTAHLKAETKERTMKSFLLSQKHVVYTEPLDVQAGSTVTVLYNPTNTVLEGKTDIWFRGSFNRWTHRLGPLPPQKMVPANNGSLVRTTVKVPLDAYMIDFVFSEKEDGGIFDNNYGVDYHIPVFGSVAKEPPMHIVHIAVEMAPIAKVGGLGDVVTSLSRAILDLNHNVDIILPKYDCLDLSNVKDFDFLMSYSWGGTEIKIWSGKVEGVPVYFLEPQNGFFWAGGIYGCRNDGERFGFFCHAALEFLLQSGSHPDIIHCHDWSSAPVTWLFKDHYMQYGLSKTRLVFTIHNLEFGTPLIGKAMAYADKATTVSPTYSLEVSGNPAIAPHLYKFHGILNGIDPDIWDPYNDKFIPVSYTAENAVEGKKAAKEALQQKLGLKRADLPLLGIITRLTHQKGIHLIKHAIWRALDRGGQVILLGSAPDSRIQNDFVNLANQLHSTHNDRARLCLTYDEPLSHLIYAGADFILVPSIFEPCGLTQLIAMRYGSIPVVRKTGGLYDTVFDVDHDKERAQTRGLEPNGFNFEGADAAGVDYAVNRAFSAWYDGREWFNSLCKLVMEQDWSWNRPALDYMELYHAARK